MLATVADAVLAGVALAAAVLAGTVAHELSHAAALSAFGVRCTVSLRPGGGDSTMRSNAPGGWATVTPTAVPEGLAPRRLRVAAMAPLCLLAPFALAAAGLLPNPLGGGLPVQAAAVGWLGCALPSPRDFSVLWYPRRALAEFRADGQ